VLLLRESVLWVMALDRALWRGRGCTTVLVKHLKPTCLVLKAREPATDALGTLRFEHVSPAPPPPFAATGDRTTRRVGGMWLYNAQNRSSQNIRQPPSV